MSILRAVAVLSLLVLAAAAVSALSGCAPKRDYWADLAGGVGQRTR